ncbi:hypothetical protein MUO32_26010 [Shinella sp. CPCC 101442]|uniref:Uncharacterized protein n=1 Tax=Shinella kummerowiae TaxID=417745 RepID=A0A6N8SBS2_9HYPH|nr:MULTISPECIES: hypothetical protein [Shinella]MCR6502487.1 hypothetical protein [Shinella sp. CPCC 101442]MXN44130.1 hypothetical protein [Shinella kummerowiae]
MHLTDTTVSRDAIDRWTVRFISDDGDEVCVTVAAAQELDAESVVDRARTMLVQLTAFGTRGGGRSANAYDAASNGNFDDDEPIMDTRH